MISRHYIAIAALCIIPVGQAASLSSGALPNDAEREALAQFKGKISGQIVWESNRTGEWELYVMNADGTNARQLTHLAKPGDPGAYESYLRPRFSPDGKTIVFGYGKQHAPAEVWIVSADGGDARKLTVGNPLNWSADGKEVFFLRDSRVWRHALATGEEGWVHKAQTPTDGRAGGTVGMLHPDLKSTVLRTARTNEYFIFDQGKTVKTMGGCEPQFSADGRYLYWVQGPKDFRVWDTHTNKEHQMLGTPSVEPFNYTYCPTVSSDARWLLYGASPGEHSHTTGDYEVYIQEMKDWKPVGKPVRLTFNKRTDRWPYLFLAPAGSRAEAPDGPYDVAGNPQTNPPPPPLPIFTFASEDAKPDFGGDWGLWPQVDGCRAEATFVAGDDAERGAGGSMRIDYTIEQEPRSFSLWMTPKANQDMSGYDRFVIFAKGNVPSFTVVVKDGNASDPDAPEGIADLTVSGVTAKWQRFDLPFAGFAPRKPGAQVDWHSINHVGVALIAPQNVTSGTLQVDNLRAVFLGTPPVLAAPKERPTRVVEALRALYTFQEGQGAHANDFSRARSPLPLTADPAGAVTWVDGGISFRAPTLVASAGPATDIVTACRRTNEITIEAWVRPAKIGQDGPARIVTLSKDSGERDFTLGQSKDRYIVRFRTTNTSANGTPALQTPAGALTTSLTHVIYTRDRGGAAHIYLNGSVAASGRVAGDLSNWRADFRLALANELTRDRTWLGDLRLVAIYSRALTSAEVTQNYHAGPSVRIDPSTLARAPETGAAGEPVGQVVWESNRGGTWQLYTINMDGTGLRQLNSQRAYSQMCLKLTLDLFGLSVS